jgi:hypothetical protein
MASDSPMRETWVKKNEPGIGAFVPARMERLGIIRGSAAAGLSRRSERVRSDAFRQIYSPRAPTEAQSRA